jgi:NAD(P)-dependent dehydrogenase (short-subunit alcohol dehydrogenase family)
MPASSSSAEKSAALQRDLTAQFPSVRLHRIPLDLSDMASVRAAAEALRSFPLDVLIHNAGAYRVKHWWHNRGYNAIRDVTDLHAESFHHIFDLYAVLIRSTGSIRGDSGFKTDHIILNTTNNNVRITDIDSEKHMLTS